MTNCEALVLDGKSRFINPNYIKAVLERDSKWKVCDKSATAFVVFVEYKLNLCESCYSNVKSILDKIKK